MKDALLILALLLLSPFILVAALIVISLVWTIFWFSIQVVFTVGGVLFVIGLLSFAVLSIIDTNYDKTRQTRPSGADRRL